MQDKRSQKPMQVSEYANSLIIDMKSLSNTLKPLSKNLYEVLLQLSRLLTAREDQIYLMLNSVLSHSLQISQYKPLILYLLALLNKTIICLKSLANAHPNSDSKQKISIILNNIIDVLIAGVSLHKDSQETSLRILQSTFSIIDHALIFYCNESMLNRMFSICFEFCQTATILQNISVSALFALVESLFQFGRLNQSFEILNSFLKCLYDSKKFIWIKGTKNKGLIWDLSVVCIKNFTPNHIIGLQNNEDCLQNINKMYNIVVDNIFGKKNKDFYNVAQENMKGNKNINGNIKQYEQITDYIRYFKAYVALSNSLSIEAMRVVDKQLVCFRATIPKMIIICDLQRNSRMFIFLEAICQLFLSQYDMPLSMEKGIVFMEILSRISQQLCLSNQSIKVNWENNEYCIDKIVTQQPKISDGDFVRLIKNTIISLRTSFQKDEDLIKCKKMKSSQKDSSRSMSSSFLPQNMGNSKKWQMFIKNVIRIIRYLSSLNFVNQQNDQDPTRRLILELQYWFLICPISKAKNMVLQELLITANVLNNKMQAIKVSQSVQIGSNILYGYFQDLDSIGLTIILKMMAGIKADWEEGKSFEELDEVYNFCSNIFAEQRLIQNDAAFLITIQAIVQCANSLIADIEQPKQKTNTQQNQQNSLKRCYKMIDYLIQRLIVVLNNNPNRAAIQWNFVTAFFITLCFNKNAKIKQEGIKSIGIIIKNLLKNELNSELDNKKQKDIMGLYIQLSKAQMKEIELALIDQLKLIMPRITQQNALMDGFRILKILSQNHKNSKQVIGNIHQLQQILIKECLFRITETKYLKLILDGMQTKSSQKNQQYRLINLLWTIADYFRKITPATNIPNQFIELWETLFKSLWLICQSTKECETKQAVIHSITQILAETSTLLPFDFLILIISKYYHQMVLLLLGIHQSSLIQSEKHPETAKVALKNYMKIFKKLVSIDKKSGEDKKQIARIISQINSSITKYVEKHIENKNSQNITIELLFQLASFISIMLDDKGFEEYGLNKDLRQMFHAIQDLIKVVQQIPSSKIDLKSHMYKKKLKPLLDKIRQTQDLEKKEEVIVQSK